MDDRSLAEPCFGLFVNFARITHTHTYLILSTLQNIRILENNKTKLLWNKIINCDNDIDDMNISYTIA